MSEQNVFDNETFFERYQLLRKNPDCANNLEEKPAVFSMLPALSGKRVLDLGCGCGENCKAFAEMGASSVLGIDLSQRMLEVARRQNSAPRVEFLELPMEALEMLPGSFDVAVSSLAIHYVRDFAKLARDVASHLVEGGVFLFSQEHPLTTAPTAQTVWVRREDGEIDHYRLTDYGRPGGRTVSWLIDGIRKYHRTFSQILNSLIGAGFTIEELREPVPTAETIQRLPDYGKDLHKPNFLVVKARKGR